MQNYSEEQVKDIKEREKKALGFLKSLNLTPAIAMHAVNIGDDTFAMKPIPYLQDTLYTGEVSPISKEQL